MSVEELITEEFTLNNAPACRLKAESLRMAAKQAVSPKLVQTYLKIAQSWEDIAADYDRSPAA
jgi:hypothetical protein